MWLEQEHGPPLEEQLLGGTSMASRKPSDAGEISIDAPPSTTRAWTPLLAADHSKTTNPAPAIAATANSHDWLRAIPTIALALSTASDIADAVRSIPIRLATEPCKETAPRTLWPLAPRANVW